MNNMANIRKNFFVEEPSWMMSPRKRYQDYKRIFAIHNPTHDGEEFALDYATNIVYRAKNKADAMFWDVYIEKFEKSDIWTNRYWYDTYEYIVVFPNTD